jgi:hyperosmotically inducible periplasmic protein
MSKVRLTLGTIGLVLLTLGFSAATATAGQTTAIKDGWLVLKLHSLFIPEDDLSGSNIDADVKDGMVTLQGTVPTEAARARAIAVAKGADGVKGVTDQLRLAPPGSDMRAAAARTADKAAAQADKAADKTAATTKKAGRALDDGWIKSKIYAQFLADWNTVLEDSNIDIDVDKGVVTLNGSVKSTAARTKAVAIAKGTDGVKSVKNLLKVVATN